MTASIAKMMCAFVKATTICHERAMFRSFQGQNYPLSILKQADVMKTFIVTATALYLNAAYKSLILKNDSYIEQAFGAMHQVCGHSYICLLHICFGLCLEVHQSIDRTQLDISSLENYHKSFETLTAPFLKQLEERMASTFKHECKGVEIATCDPKVDLFIVSVTKNE